MSDLRTAVLRAPAVAALVLLLAVPQVSAQQQFIADAGLVVDSDPTLRSRTTTTVGITGAIGLFLSDRVSLRLELDLPGWHVSNLAGESRVRNHIERHAIREEARARTVSILLARHVGRGRRFGGAVLGGLALATRASRSSGYTARLDLDGTVLEHRTVSRADDGFTWRAVTLGGDVTIPVSRTVAVVPQVRLNSYFYSDHTSLVFVRSRVSLRWGF
ncbi:MAG TPA: hypothetical protein VM364_12130 [Vicinamibacterales bacterium]|nr:hypothetical protein [Vicinamibacterales bacterium]